VGPIWEGTIRLNTEAFTVGGKLDATNWIDLWGGQKWYKSRKGKEQEFTGVLKKRELAGVKSTLQRSWVYTLAGRRIYPGRPHPVLEQLVGKKVTIRGKAVEMSLEGQRLRELWAGAAKLAK
jgi:hypothetical protein